MKRIRDIFKTLCSIENIAMAHQNARKGKAHYREVKKVDANPEKYFTALHDMLEKQAFSTSPYVAMVRTESGKRREILKSPYFPDRIVHHCIVQVLSPVWYKNLIRDTYACIPKRGIHDGVNRIRQALCDQPGTRYCLKMDAKKFYPSIDQDILKVILRKKIKDPDVLALIDGIIDSTEAGVPIGNYLSQFFGNLYLSGYDHWMKECHQCKYYFRYCDDVVILGPSKTRLHDLRRETDTYWSNRLKLTVKGNWQVFPIDARGIDFLGYRFFHGYILLRKSTAKNFKRKMRLLKRHWRKMPPVSVLSTVMSYEGWLRPANCLNLKKSHIDHEIKDIVSDVSRKMNINNPLWRCVV
jgi:retron-type reverse transcriptase